GNYVRLMPYSATFDSPCFALLRHDWSRVLGNTANNTLRLFSDDYGVRVEIDLPDTQTGRDVAELVDKGYIAGMSFAMSSNPEGEWRQEGGRNIYDATSYSVSEVSVVADPAFAATSIAVQ